SYNNIIDGSGLARGDRLQPKFIANILEWMAISDKSQSFVSLFPKVGEDGTVQSLLRDTRLKGMLALKSGSMSSVQCYAGYKLDEKGSPTHVVVILVNGFFCERPALRKSIENFLLKTF
ncbi:MAG: D-alanyl-D-alanine carboxypeptidase, partial [Muribaculaceae bacterium]|nr:D-alanyl-D-alanine carboxypeptidase [Muribaculaceae bacterium]